jgi:hypothetical protein
LKQSSIKRFIASISLPPLNALLLYCFDFLNRIAVLLLHCFPTLPHLPSRSKENKLLKGVSDVVTIVLATVIFFIKFCRKFRAV